MFGLKPGFERLLPPHTNGIRPVNTPLLEELLADPDARARRLVHVPMGRLAEASEVARAALFLASDDAAYVNGSTFLVDGGITAAYVTPED